MRGVGHRREAGYSAIVEHGGKTSDHADRLTLERVDALRCAEMFSERSSPSAERDRWSQTLAEKRARGDRIVDLTENNPTRVSIPYDGESIRRALAAPRDLLHYEPDPFGLASARRAIAAELARDEIEIDPSNLVLTASAREAYAFLFALLCDAGDDVLAPQPSDPALSQLAHVNGVSIAPYELTYDGRWQFDARELWDAIGDRTRAIVVASPNRPTGSYLSREQADALAELGLPIIVDELYGAFPLETPEDRARGVEVPGPIVFTLDGLSKRAALPQMKLAWIALSGDPSAVSGARDRIALIADTFLSVATPVQLALADLFEHTRSSCDAIRARTRRNLEVLRAAARGGAIEVPRVEGGWYAPIRLRDARADATWALDLLERGIAIQPGDFYEFSDRESWLVSSLLTPESEYERGIEAIVSSLDRA
jgi:alanine-synthesizing transaminase